jgi:DNA processing protein
MASPNESAALVVLLRSGKRPWQQYADVVEDAGSAIAVLTDERASTQTLFGDPDDPDRAEDEIAKAAAEIEQWEREGMRLLTVLDSGYPDNLRTVHDRPPLIFLAGELLPQDSRSIAVVGARNASPHGRDAAAAISAHLVSAGYTVVSGLALGIDTAAHTAALASSDGGGDRGDIARGDISGGDISRGDDGGGRTVAVIGTGLRRAYPPENAPLQRRIAQTGAVISQFWPDAPPSKRSFPMRNAVMSGLSLASVVVEASERSGSRMQARLALEHGRPVFLSSRLLDQEWARQLAERPGTHVFQTPQEITAAVERLTSSGALVP